MPVLPVPNSDPVHRAITRLDGWGEPLTTALCGRKKKGDKPLRAVPEDHKVTCRLCRKLLNHPQVKPSGPSQKERDLIEFVKKIPDHILMPEAARRQVAKRKSHTRKPKTVRKCIWCPEWLGAVEMRIHVAKAHPGGLQKWQPARNREKGEMCLYCPTVCSKGLEMYYHVRTAHPEKVPDDEPKGQPIILPPQPIPRVKTPKKPRRRRKKQEEKKPPGRPRKHPFGPKRAPNEWRQAHAKGEPPCT